MNVTVTTNKASQGNHSVKASQYDESGGIEEVCLVLYVHIWSL